MRPHLGVMIIALVLLGASAVAAASGAEEYVFVTAWGSGGTGDGQFNLSYGAALDGAGNVYICDFQNNRVQKFTSNGTFLGSWGSYGTANGQFRHPTGVAVDAAGTVYVADHYNHRVQKFTSSGAFLARWGVYGSADGQMSFPYGIDLDDAGNVYVADYYNARVQKFTSSGAYLMKLGVPGTGNGQFTYPAGVAVDHAGTIYVADQYNHRVQKFRANGSFLAVLGGNGTADDQMRYPTNIAFDSENNAYVADHGHHRIQKFSPAGTLITLWGTRGAADGEFWSPTGIAIDPAGTVFVADTNNNRVEVFVLNGTAPPPAPTPATPTATPTTPVPQGPYPSAHAVPGTVQAEDFDAGGEGVAYHDLEPANLGGAHRPSEGVDVETAGGLTNVGWVRAGEYPGVLGQLDRRRDLPADPAGREPRRGTEGRQRLARRPAGRHRGRDRHRRVDAVRGVHLRPVRDGGGSAHRHALVRPRRPGQPGLAPPRDRRDTDSDPGNDHHDAGGAGRRGLRRGAVRGPPGGPGEVHPDPGGRQGREGGLVVVRRPRAPEHLELAPDEPDLLLPADRHLLPARPDRLHGLLGRGGPPAGRGPGDLTRPTLFCGASRVTDTLYAPEPAGPLPAPQGRTLRGALRRRSPDAAGRRRRLALQHPRLPIFILRPPGS